MVNSLAAVIHENKRNAVGHRGKVVYSCYKWKLG